MVVTMILHINFIAEYVIMFKLHCIIVYSDHIGSVTAHESVSVHHLPRGSTASGLQSLQDNGTQAPTSHARVRNCKHTVIVTL